MMSQNNDLPPWVIEVRKEIKRLDQKIRRLNELADRDEMTDEHYADMDNWSGWRDALRWVLKMRNGKAMRQDAWGRS